MNGNQVAERMVAQAMGYSPVNQAPTLRRLASAVDTLYGEAEAGSEEEAFFDEMLDVLNTALREKLPPFSPGQHVYVLRPNGGRSEFIVDACERAFGEWAVKGHFGREAWHPYIYPAELLEAI